MSRTSIEIKPIKEHFSLSKIYLKNHSGDGAQELANIGVGNTAFKKGLVDIAWAYQKRFRIVEVKHC